MDINKEARISGAYRPVQPILEIRVSKLLNRDMVSGEAILKFRLPAPCLGEVPWLAEPTVEQMAAYLSLGDLLPGR